MLKISNRQLEIYNYIKEYIHLYKFPPTIREIGKHFNIKSTNGVRDALNALEKKMYIKKSSNQARGIELLQNKSNVYSEAQHVQHLHIIGNIAAGTPILAEENIEETLTIDDSLLPKSSEVFALRVHGDSMTGDGIFNNDIAIIRMQKNAERGQIVAAVINGEATLKHYYPLENRIELRASNIKYPPINIGSFEDFYIAGILSGIIRKC